MRDISELVDYEVSEEHGSGKENKSIIDALQDAVLENDGTFYLFYDKYQMIQGGTSVEFVLPDCIENSDCKLTLHKNCRNTKEIARTSLTPLKDKKNKVVKTNVAYSWEGSIKPIFYLIDEPSKTMSILNETLSDLEREGADDIVILTPGTVEQSSISKSLRYSADPKDGYAYYVFNEREYKVTTCIRFKGLEAKAVIVIDLDEDSFTGKKGLEFYVGASRAKQVLNLICSLDSDSYYSLAHELDPNAPRREDPERMKRILADIFAVKLNEPQNTSETG